MFLIKVKYKLFSQKIMYDYSYSNKHYRNCIKNEIYTDGWMWNPKYCIFDYCSIYWNIKRNKYLKKMAAEMEHIQLHYIIFVGEL